MLEAWHWIIIGVIAVIFILWGPAKIPEFAKTLSKSRGELTQPQEKSATQETQSNY